MTGLCRRAARSRRRVRRVPRPEVISLLGRRRRRCHTLGKLATSNAPDGEPRTEWTDGPGGARVVGDLQKAGALQYGIRRRRRRRRWAL